MTSLKKILWLAALTFSSVVSSSLAQKLNVPVEKYVLQNGLTVILHVDKSLPTAAVNLWYRVGSKDEPANRSGFAHLFEHLMFMGTKAAPNFDKIMEAGGGSNNASTNADYTNYYSSGPSAQLPTLLWLEADRMANLGKNIDQKKLDLQRNVVLNEMRQNVIDTPYAQAEDALTKYMYPANHPYFNPVIGNEEDLKAATVDDVKRFFNTYYVPNNAAMVVAGDFDPKKIKPLISSLFKVIPRASDVLRKPVPDAKLTSVKRATFADNVSAPKVIMAWHSPRIYGYNDAETDLMAQLLGEGYSSRLYQNLVVDGLADDVSVSNISQALGGMFVISAIPASGITPGKLEAAIDQNLKDFLKKGVTSAELLPYVRSLETRKLEELQDISAKADALNNYQFYLANPNSFAFDLDRYRKVTPKSLLDRAKKVLNFSARVVFNVLPAPDRSVGEVSIPRPQDNALTAFKTPNLNEFSLSNGVRVNYWQRSNLPLIYISTLLRGGAEHEKTINAGRSSMMADLLGLGAGKRNAQAFEQALNGIGATFQASSDLQFTSVNLSVATANLKTALELYSDALLRPSLKIANFKEVQRARLSELAAETDDIDTVARKVALREFFGRDHPAANSLNGNVSSISRMQLGDVLSEYKLVIQPRNALIFAAGSLKVGDFKKALELVLKGWKNTNKMLETVEYPQPANQTRRVVIVDRPGSSQTAIRFMFPAPLASDPNSNQLLSLNVLLGDTFTSRLMQNLREDKGYTYGVSSSLRQSPEAAYLRIATDVEVSVTGASLREFLNEFKRLSSGDITPEEASKTAAVRRFNTISSLGTLDGLVSTAQDLYSNGKPFSSLGLILDELVTIDASSLNALAPSLLPLEKSLLVLVGDKNLILGQLEGLGLPEPEDAKF
jgi:predicted Zn-dependent peptidase